MTMKRSTKIMAAACAALVMAIVAIGCQIKNDLACNQNEVQELTAQVDPEWQKVLDENQAREEELLKIDVLSDDFMGTDKEVEVTRLSANSFRIDVRYDIGENESVVVHLFMPVEAYKDCIGIRKAILHARDPGYLVHEIGDLTGYQYDMYKNDFEWSRGDEPESINYLTSVTAYYE